MTGKSGVVLGFRTPRSANLIDHADVARAADLLQRAYGDQALARARQIEAQARIPEFAEAVTLEVERRLGENKP